MYCAANDFYSHILSIITIYQYFLFISNRYILSDIYALLSSLTVLAPCVFLSPLSLKGSVHSRSNCFSAR